MEYEAKTAQAKFNRPFEDALSHKSAEKSAAIFGKEFQKEKNTMNSIAKTIYDEGKISRFKIDEYVRKYGGYRSVDKTVTFADGSTANVIYEGLSTDITSDGKILSKVLAPVENTCKVEHENMTKSLTDKIKMDEVAQRRMMEETEGNFIHA